MAVIYFERLKDIQVKGGEALILCLSQFACNEMHLSL